MNNESDDFSSVIENVKVERKRNPFEINQLKIEHFYWDYDNIDVGAPVSTSVELICNYNYEEEILEWNKIISHTYLSIDNDSNYTTDTYQEKIENPDKLIKKIEKYDLRDLKNNYFTEEEPERFTHWELTYNNYFKIVGTYDQDIKEFKEISKLLNFKGIIKEEVNKIQEKLKNNK